MDQNKIKSMKYNELQKLAKKVGIKANMKLDKLREALFEHSKTVQDDEIPAPKPEETETNETSPVKNQEQTGAECRNIKKGKRRKGATKTTVEAANVSYTPKATKQTPAKTLSTPVLYRKSLGTPKVDSNAGKKPSGRPKIGTPSNAGRKSTPGQVKAESKLQGRNSFQTPKSASKRKSKDNVSESNEDKRKVNRRSTFECVPTPELTSDQPPSQPDSRRSTFVVKETPELPGGGKTSKVEEKKKNSVSPGVKELEECMKPEMSDAEMKESLMKALDKKVQSKIQSGATQIPRFVSFLAKKKQEAQKPVTPGNKDWNKIHQKNFDKMESIDAYLEKKRKRAEEYSSSVKKAKMLQEEMKAVMSKLKNHKTPNNNKAKSLFQTPGNEKVSVAVPFKPTVLSTKQMNLNFSKVRKSPRTSGAKPFKPSVISTKDINLNFGSQKTPQVVTRKSPHTSIKKENSVTLGTRKSLGSAIPRKSFGTTPFKFNATLNATMNNTMSAKKTFDLKASLARPITWRTHKGKLKPLKTQPIYTQQGNNNSTVPSVKTPKVQTRGNRRTNAMKKRAEKKFTATMNRRGIKA